jgi:hypothetical protein
MLCRAWHAFRSSTQEQRTSVSRENILDCGLANREATMQESQPCISLLPKVALLTVECGGRKGEMARPSCSRDEAASAGT